MPLSEEELRLLEQMERALVAEDPKLASTLRGTTLRASARRRSYLAAGVFVVGVAVLMTGAVLQQTLVGIAGFVVMLISAYVALISWRGQNHVNEPPKPQQGAASFAVIEGGRSRRRGRSRGADSKSHQSMMERFEARWRRRRDQRGF